MDILRTGKCTRSLHNPLIQGHFLKDKGYLKRDGKESVSVLTQQHIGFGVYGYQEPTGI